MYLNIFKSFAKSQNRRKNVLYSWKRNISRLLDTEINKLSDFGETTLELRYHVRKFAEKYIEPIAAEIDIKNEFPKELWKELGNIGILGPTISEEYGGLNMGYQEHVICMEELSRSSASIALSYGAHTNLCINQIFRHGTNEQKKRYLPPLIAGERIGSLAMSEQQAGSDVMSMKLSATKDVNNDTYILNGNKMWITNGSNANIIVVYAKIKDATTTNNNNRSITAFIIDTDESHVERGKLLNKLGMRGSDTCELVFNNCHVPARNILGKIYDGTMILMSGLDTERLVLAGGPLGIMQACIDSILPYINIRKQFQKSIGEFELIQAKVADMYTMLQSTRSYIYAIAKCADKGYISRKDCASAILLASENATQCALQTIQIFGGIGYMNDCPAGRFLRDAKLYEIGAGTSEIRRYLIGRTLLNDVRERTSQQFD